MSPAAAAATGAWMTRLADHVHATAEFGALYLGDAGAAPPRGSPAALEVVGATTGTEGEQLRVAYDIAGLLTFAAQQSLFALERLLRPPLPLYAYEVTFRSVLEACARAWWIGQPALAPITRIQRALTEQAHSAAETTKMTRAYLKAYPEATQALEGRSDRYAEQAIIDQAAQVGMAFVCNAKGSPRHVGEPRPRSTNLVDEFFSACNLRGGEGLYRQTSGIVHAVVGSVVQPFATGTPGTPSPPMVGRGVLWSRVAAADDAYFQVLRCRSVTHGLPVEHLEDVIGHKRAKLQALVPEEAVSPPTR